VNRAPVILDNIFFAKLLEKVFVMSDDDELKVGMRSSLLDDAIFY